ncbi:LanC-like protein 3 [Balamuthia mandrillaris]
MKPTPGCFYWGLLVVFAFQLLLAFVLQHSRAMEHFSQLGESERDRYSQTNRMDNASCPQHVGPPCPRFYVNDMPDYRPGDPVFISEELRRNMSVRGSQYLELILQGAPPERDFADGWDVMSGSAGRALLFFHLYKNSVEQDERQARSFLAIAARYINSSLQAVEKDNSAEKNQMVGFMYSAIGPYSVAAVVYDLLGDAPKSQTYISRVLATFKEVLKGKRAFPDPFDEGKAGLLFAAYFLNDHFGGKRDGAPYVIPEEWLNELAHSMLSAGVRTGNETVLKWRNVAYPDVVLYDQGHGTSGVLFQMMHLPKFMANATVSNLIRSTLDFLLTLQLPNGNFPTPTVPPLPEEPDVLLQWCHGAPGYMPLFTKAWILYNDRRYLNAAKRAAEAVWKRGLLTKGLMLGHGVSGNTYMFLYMYRMTKEPKYLYQAIRFQEYTLSHAIMSDPEVMRKPEPSPFMFFVGSYASAAVLWSDMLSSLKLACMPAFEVC